MKKILTIFLLCTAAIGLRAQSSAATLWGELKKQETLSMDFSLKGVDKDGVVVSDETGKAYLQGDCYRIECGDMLICCDGVSMWLYNTSSEELVIDVDGALPFMNATDVKRDQKGNINATYTADDVIFKVKVSGIKNPGQKYSGHFFKIDESALPEEVIVTDLRD